MKNGDVLRYHSNNNDYLRYYMNELTDESIVVALCVFRDDNGSDIVYCVNQDKKFGFDYQRNFKPSRIKKDKLPWAPKFVIGDNVYVKRHEHPWADYDEIVSSGMIYSCQQKVVDVYKDEDTGGYIYELNEKYCVPVLEKFLMIEEEFDPEIIPEDIDEILV